MTKRKKILNTKNAWFAFLITTLLCSQGCVYLRLLNLKHQFADVDRNFALKKENGLVLVFKNPVLYREDIHFLACIGPTRTVKKSDGLQMQYEYRKEIKGRIIPGKDLSKITVRVGINKADKAERITFPEEFLALMPEAFMRSLITSVGKGKVDRKNKSLTAEWHDLQNSEKPTAVPGRKEIRSTLGIPSFVRKKDDGLHEVYRYKYVKPPGCTIKKKYFAGGRFIYDANTGKLLRSIAVLGGMSIDIDYVGKKKEPNPEKEKRIKARKRRGRRRHAFDPSTDGSAKN